ncbi:50S ribosomal protein L11 methyltransferase [soil metagenome]
MNYLELKVSCKESFSKILIAELSEIGFDSFLEGANGFNAYIELSEFHPPGLEELQKKYSLLADFNYQLREVEKKNWNEEWEKNYDPIIVENKCIVRASFHHIEQSFPFEITINPKMSFGTGHHATTYLMLSQQLNLDHRSKVVLDAGCGTGILAIMASLAGADSIFACDIDEWAIDNCIENFSLNNCYNVQAFHGTIQSLPPGKIFDIILANINKNVLLNDIPHYALLQKVGSRLVLSGYYQYDIKDISVRCLKSGYVKINDKVKDQWACNLFIKEN